MTQNNMPPAGTTPAQRPILESLLIKSQVLFEEICEEI